MEKNPTSGNAIHTAGEGTIAGIRKTQELSAPVSSAHKLWSQLHKKGWGEAQKQSVVRDINLREFPEKQV